ncbi:unnamed protein product [Dracunculus medinensis]|uniref:TonB_C domain-containing protein n=1 Tax=Dracunculus medinensis TaxID=318479 RepID=A0A0N4U5A7_DRAME|nr:unnamed protein product [Dracunculus medinensis]
MLRYFPILLLFVSYCSSFSLPAGLRPAKAVGDPKQAIIPERDQQINNGVSPKVPSNLSLRSRMMAALSGTPVESKKESVTEMPEKSQDVKVELKTPIIFTKGNKKIEVQSTPVVAKNKARIDPKKLGSNNYGLNTAVQISLVDSHGRVMKGINLVPIKVPSTDDLKNARTRHTAREVESGADKIVPIKFGSAT